MAVLALSETSICNMALGKIGGGRINDFGNTTESSEQAIQCRLHYEITRDALIRSHYWRFASARATLSADTSVSVSEDFEWDNRFKLPTDFMRFKSFYGDNLTVGNKVRFPFALEGKKLLTNESPCKIRYIKKVTDPQEFDPLFIEVLVLLLARKLVGPLAGGDPKLKAEIKDDLRELMPSVRALDRQETNTSGRAVQQTWVDVRATRGGRIDSRLGSA